MSNVEGMEFLRKYQKWMEYSPLEKIMVMEKRVIIIRWLGILIGIVTVPFLGLKETLPIYLLIAYALIHNIFFQFVIIPYRNHWLMKPAVLTFGDIFMASAAVYITGGLNSDFYLIYFLLAVLSAVRFGRNEAILSISLSTTLYCIVIYLSVPVLTSFDIAEVILRMGFVVITGLFVGYFGDRTRQIELDLQKELDKAHAHLNESTARLNKSLELKDVLQVGVEQACHLSKAELSMIIMEDSSAKFLSRDYQDTYLKPYFFRRKGTKDLNVIDIRLLSFLFQHITSSMKSQKIMYKNKSVSIIDCTSNENLKKILLLDECNAFYLISLPLVNGEKRLGTLYLLKMNHSIMTLRESQVDLMFLFAHSISTAVSNSLDYTQSKQQAITDPVTGLYNHRFLQETIKKELAISIESQRALSLIVLDIDSFKQFNDTHGHSVGDVALKHVAKLIQESIYEKGLAARYGGDEFVIILPSISNKEACVIAELIRRKTFEYSAGASHEALKSLNISLGVATAPRSGTTAEDLFNAADLALYIAKYSGKNIVQSAFDLPDLETFNQLRLSPKYSKSKKLVSFQKVFYKNSSLEIELIEAFIAAVDARDHYTYDHSDNVSNYSMKLAKKMNLSEVVIEKIRLGALIHDIGKIGVPDNILNKSEKLTNEEYEIVKQHPIIGAKIIQPIKSLGVYSPIIMYHHEWFNGNGYPFGLKGEEIPLEARIVSICDAYDAMTTNRPYRKAMSNQKALQLIKEMVGKQFDPNIWGSFYEMIKVEYEVDRGEMDGRHAMEIV